MSGIGDTQYLLPNHACDFFYCRSHLSVYPNLVIEETATLVAWSWSLNEICDHDQPVSNPWPDPWPCRNWSQSVKTSDPHTVTDRQTHTHTNKIRYIAKIMKNRKNHCDRWNEFRKILYSENLTHIVQENFIC